MGRHAPYSDRSDAGRALADALAAYRGRPGVVLGLPRGGVPVAFQVAQALGLPLDVLMVRKLGVPGHEELAMGAIAMVGPHIELVRNDAVVARAKIEPDAFDTVRERESAELRRRVVAFRGDRPAPDLTGAVILVDDGLATGSTMLAAARAIRSAAPDAHVVVGVPVGSRESRTMLESVAADVVCCWTPSPFYAVGQAYRDFRPTSDAEVRALLSG